MPPLVWCGCHYIHLSAVLILVLVTRKRIPDAVYESWNTQPIVAGSDSEGDGNGSEVELLSDMDSIGDDADHNPELANSLMEMELTDSEDSRNVHDRKGKGRLMTGVETPKHATVNGGFAFCSS